MPNQQSHLEHLTKLANCRQQRHRLLQELSDSANCKCCGSTCVDRVKSSTNPDQSLKVVCRVCRWEHAVGQPDSGTRLEQQEDTQQISARVKKGQETKENEFKEKAAVEAMIKAVPAEQLNYFLQLLHASTERLRLEAARTIGNNAGR